MMGKFDALNRNLNFLNSIFSKPSKGLFLFSSFIRSAVNSSVHVYATGILRKASSLLAIFFIAFTGNATTYYVSAKGNDANNGLTTATTWHTISKVNSAIFAAGDSIFFKRGDVWRGKLYIVNSGTINKPIVYSTYGTGNLPEFNNVSSAIITLYHTQYVVIDGIKIIDNSISTTDHSITAKIRYAIILTNSPNCTIKNCDISLVGEGISVGGTSTNTTITGNYMHNLRMVVNTVGGYDDYGANPIVIATSNNTITYNRFEECWALSYDYGYDGGAVEIFGDNMNNNLIMYNTAINCNGFMEIGSRTKGVANNNIIAYNKIINCGTIGTYHNSGTFATSINNLQYYNNTIVETVKQYTKPGVMFSMSGTGKTGMVVVKNNIFWLSDTTNIASSNFNTGQMVHTNNIYRMSGGTLGITLGSTEILSTTATVFASTLGDPSIWNYALPAGSPAIIFGTNVGYTRDFIGNPIIGNPDAGILEFSSHKYYVPNITNQLPKANAGPDQAIILPSNKINLSGSGTDPDGTISSYLWTKIFGPKACTIANINSASTSVIGLVQGVYKFELKVTDNNGAIGKDTMQVIVNTATTQPLTASAGGNQTITLPVNTVLLNGSGKNTEGTVVTFFWTKISGPTSYNIVNTSSPVTNISGLIQGVYKFELKITDNNGITERDTMQVIVNAATNIPPVANAGADQSITLPTNAASLNGSGTGADGGISSYSWTKISGPSTDTITNVTSATTLVSGLVQGVYKFELKVTDKNGATGIDTMQITVNAGVAANIPPVANAGADQAITLPTNTTSLNGSGTDADGTITGYSWKQISGDSVSGLVFPNAAVTFSNKLVAGTYEFELTVTDNMGAIDRDTVVVVVGIPRINLDVQSNNIKIYPNPWVGTAILEINTTQANAKLLIVITNIQGQIVYKNELVLGQNNIKEKINMSNLSKGTYAITVYFSDQEKQTIKVMRLD